MRGARLRSRLQDAADDADHGAACGDVAQNNRLRRAVDERHIRDAHALADLRAAGRRSMHKSPMILVSTSSALQMYACCTAACGVCIREAMHCLSGA